MNQGITISEQKEARNSACWVANLREKCLEPSFMRQEKSDFSG